MTLEYLFESLFVANVGDIGKVVKGVVVLIDAWNWNTEMEIMKPPF